MCNDIKIVAQAQNCKLAYAYLEYDRKKLLHTCKKT